MTPAQRSARARLAAHTRWAHEPDRTAATAPATRGAFARFENEVDPDRRLTPNERYRRAKHAQKAHMAALRLRQHR